jgi:hypothetical protein
VFIQNPSSKFPWKLVVLAAVQAFYACTTASDEVISTSASSPMEAEPKDLGSASSQSASNSLTTSPQPPSASSQAMIRAPEEEISEAKSRLANLALKLAATRQINQEKTMEADDIRGKESLLRAEALASKKHWLATIRELNSYLNRTQVPEKKSYLRSHYLLGKAYEGLRSPSRAGRAYVRYVAAALDVKENEATDLPEVIERLIVVASKEATNGSTLNPLLASLVAADLPKDMRPKVLYFVGKSALNQKNMDLAKKWLSAASAISTDPFLKNKITYLQGLILLSSQEWDEAEELFLSLSKSEDDAGNRDLARLALARIGVHRRKTDLALKLYEQIPEDSGSFQEASFERIYLHLSRKEHDKARNQAVFFLGRFPESQDALQIRLLLAYLDMQAGDLDQSEQSLKKADKRLDDISQWLSTKMAGRSRISQNLLRDFLSVSQQTIQPIPTVKEASSLFESIADIARRLADTHGEIQSLYYAISRVNLSTLRPTWHQQEVQLKAIAEEALTIGHKLAASERLLHKNQLDPVHWQKLVASEARRIKISGSPAIRIPNYGRNGDTLRFLKLSNMTAETYQKLRTAEAELGSARLLTQRNEQGNNPAPSRLLELEEKRKRINQTLESTLRQLRQSKVEVLIGLSPFRKTERFINQYAMALQEESEIFKQMRDSTDETHLRLTAEDASLAWDRWESVMKDIFSQLNELDLSVKQGLTGIFTELDRHEQRYAELSGRLKSINSELERKLGVAVPYLVEQYTHTIQDRFSRHRKWLADIEWLKYQKIVESDQKISKRLELEQQILKDNLTDLQQGVTQKWLE